MTWPPTRPVRRRLFGVVFLVVWVVGMYLCWGVTMVPFSPDYRVDSAGVVGPAYEQRYGISTWLIRREFLSEATGTTTSVEWHVLPRGVAVGLIMIAVSGFVLYIAWRSAVRVLVCAKGTCDVCGYDLRALSACRCPECGTETPEP